MKVAILSFVKNLNYGGSLQEYALAQAIEKYSENHIECEYLNYGRNFYKDSIIWLLRKIWYKILNKDDNPSWTLIEFISILISRKKANQSNSAENFKKFWTYTKFSQRVNKREIKNIEKEYDLVIVGSDQVWNCGRLNLDSTFLLDFVSDDKKKGSYASSVGMKNIPIKYARQYKNYLSRIRFLSCREIEGKELIQKLTGREVQHVLDPTLLLDINEWKKVSENVFVEGKYILMYMLDTSDSLEQFAEKLSENKKIKVVKIYSQIDKNDGIGPQQWINLVMNAEYIVTNSFHGLAFSINFNKQFWIEITQKDFFVESSSRITDTLKLYNLENRLCNSGKNEDLENIIDYSQVNEKIFQMRMESEKYLKRMLNSIEK